MSQSQSQSQSQLRLLQTPPKQQLNYTDSSFEQVDLSVEQDDSSVEQDDSSAEQKYPKYPYSLPIDQQFYYSGRTYFSSEEKTLSINYHTKELDIYLTLYKTNINNIKDIYTSFYKDNNIIYTDFIIKLENSEFIINTLKKYIIDINREYKSIQQCYYLYKYNNGLPDSFIYETDNYFKHYNSNISNITDIIKQTIEYFKNENFIEVSNNLKKSECMIEQIEKYIHYIKTDLDI